MPPTESEKRRVQLLTSECPTCGEKAWQVDDTYYIRRIGPPESRVCIKLSCENCGDVVFRPAAGYALMLA